MLTRSMGGHEVSQTNFEGYGRGSSIRWDRAHKGGTNGIWENTFNNSGIGYAWKTGPCFDWVQYKGLANGVRTINHNLGGVPQLMIGRRWHTNGGNSGWNIYFGDPTKYFDGFEQNHGTSSSRWNNTAPTSTIIKIGTSSAVNQTDSRLKVVSWRSIAGISKVGSYTGDGNARTITTGFQPRFVWLKNVSDASDYDDNRYIILDTTRGWASGNDSVLKDAFGDAAQVTNLDVGQPTSSGFTLTAPVAGNSTAGMWNENNTKYIYYAHA